MLILILLADDVTFRVQQYTFGPKIDSPCEEIANNQLNNHQLRMKTPLLIVNCLLFQCKCQFASLSFTRSLLTMGLRRHVYVNQVKQRERERERERERFR